MIRRYIICPALALCLLAAGCGKVGSDTESETPAAAAPYTEVCEASSEEAASEAPATTEAAAEPAEEGIVLRTNDGETYYFDCGGETYTAIYTPDNWKIINSYKIRDKKTMTEICRALSEENPVRGADMSSYRTPEDMAYEWEQHNIAYDLLSDNSPYKGSVRDVDLNPEDQGKDVYELFLDRLGLSDLF